jgi:hypothetical protein
MYVLVHLGSPCSKSHLIDIFCQRGNNPRIENPQLKTGITEPSELAVELNAQGLACYAIICQENGYQLNIKGPHYCSFLLSIAVHCLPMYSDVEASSDSFATFSS